MLQFFVFLSLSLPLSLSSPLSLSLSLIDSISQNHLYTKTAMMIITIYTSIHL